MKTKARKIAPPSCEQLRCRGAWWRLSLTLLVALCCHTAASAQETLTVYEGTAISQHIPVFGTYTDTQGCASEFVIPSGQLGDMKDGTISALTFYLQQSALAAWTATIQVYLKEIDATTLTGITGPDASTVVYTGTLDATGTVMTVTFSTPYTYKGGNLLMGTYISVAGNYKSANFYGVSQNATTAWYRNGSAIAGYGESFIPQTTFTYTPPSSVVPKPNNLAASNITPEQATITWSSDQSAWDISWSTDPDFDPASVSTRANNVTEKTFTITSLNQLTDYYVAVQNAGSNRWSQKLHFKTTSKPTAVEDGWSDDFEGATCGWELFNGELTNKWTWGTATNNGGTHALYISNDGGTNNTYNTSSSTMVYAAKLLTFTEGTFDFSYDWRADGEGNHDYLRVALIPATVSLTAGTSVPEGLGTTTLPTGWIALDGGSKLNLVTAWQSKVATIDVATAGNYYLVFAWCNDGGVGNNPPAAIDNVSISKYPDKVTDLAVSDVTATTATVSWNGNGDSYTVKYTKLFLSEGFEGGMPTGWTSEGDASWSVGTGDYSTSTGSHSGDYNAKITHTTKNNVTYLITPSMDLSGETSVKLSFWFVNNVWVSDIDGFGVYYRVGNNGTWTELWSTTEAHGSWTNQEITLKGLAADYQLGFKMTDGSGFGVGLDDIQILADWQTVNDITTKSTTLTGLDANTTYGCQVQSVKAGKTSFWSPIATFTTTENIAILTEVNPIAPLTAMNGKQTKVMFERSGLTPGKYSTICLPYDFTPSETCTFYTFKGVTKENNVWVADISVYTGTLTANTPYIFTTESTTSVTFYNDAVIAAASYSDASANTIATNDADWTFQGTYSAINLPKDDEYDYGFAAGDGSEIEIGTFVHLVSGASAAPFRAYLKYTGSDVNWAKAPNRSGATNGDALPQRIIVRVVGSNGQTTAIGTIDTKTGDITFDSNEWYSLDGLKLNGAPSTGGIYIKDGKKIIVK